MPAASTTAPQILPSPASATLTAQSVADPSKQISVAVAITSSFSLQLYRASERASRSNGHNRRDANARSRLEPQCLR